MNTLELKGRYCKIDAEAQDPANLLIAGEEDIKLSGEDTAFLLVDTYVKDEDFLQVTKKYIKPALQAAREAGLHIIHVSNSCPKIALANSEFQKKLKQSLDNDMEINFNEANVDPREYADTLHEDLKLQAELKKCPETTGAEIADVEIIRHPQRITIVIHTSRPGIIIGAK